LQNFIYKTHTADSALGLIGGGLLIANHLDQSETLSSNQSDHIYYTLLCSVAVAFVLATANSLVLSQIHFAELNRHSLTFSSSNLYSARITSGALLDMLFLITY
jgi:hypothetical protein